MKNNKKSKNIKKAKVVITFDEKSRREYITGFRRRKHERKETAKKAIDNIIKIKKKADKAKKRAGLKKKVEELLEGKDILFDKFEGDNPDSLKGKETKVNFESHEVTITSELDFTSSGLVLGENKNQEEEHIPSYHKDRTKKKVRFSDNHEDLEKFATKGQKKLSKNDGKNRLNRRSKHKQKKKKSRK